MGGRLCNDLVAVGRTLRHGRRKAVFCVKTEVCEERGESELQKIELRVFHRIHK
jgi:hypothetical protein